MACIWMDGFEIGESNDSAGIWTSVTPNVGGGLIEYDIVNPRSFAGSLKVTNTDAATSRYLSQTLPSNYSQLYGGFAIYFDSSQVITEKYYDTLPFFAVNATNGSTHLTMGLNVDTMQLVVFRGEVTPSGTKIATGSIVFEYDTWYYIQWRYVINNTSGLVQVRINGTVDINKSPIDTRVSGPSNIAEIELGIMGGTAIINFDDVVVNDTTGSIGNGWPGNASVQFITPDSPGFYSNWLSTGATIWGEVDDLVLHGSDDGDTTAIGSNVVGGHASANMEDVAPIGDINAIMLITLAKVELSVPMAQFVRLYGNNSYLPTYLPNFDTYGWHYDILPVNPFFTTNWADTDVTDLEMGWVAF